MAKRGLQSPSARTEQSEGRERIGEWADSLIRSKKALESFIKRLVKEQQRGKAA